MRKPDVFNQGYQRGCRETERRLVTEHKRDKGKARQESYRWGKLAGKRRAAEVGEMGGRLKALKMVLEQIAESGDLERLRRLMGDISELLDPEDTGA